VPVEASWLWLQGDIERMQGRPFGLDGLELTEPCLLKSHLKRGASCGSTLTLTVARRADSFTR